MLLNIITQNIMQYYIYMYVLFFILLCLIDISIFAALAVCGTLSRVAF